MVQVVIMNHDTQYLERCRFLIEQKLNWRPADEWRNYEFNELSEKILDATGVNLSSTTLKRIFGKLKYDSLPSSVTLNALANYLGFASWMDFKSNQSEIQKPVVVTEIPRKARPLLQTPWLTGAASLAVFAILAFTFLPGKPVLPVTNEGEIIFKSRPLAQGLPNSVVFQVDLKDNKTDDIIIQQSWDSTKTVKLVPGQKEATGIYYMPGYFRAKLILDGRIVKEHDLFIRSDNWMATLDKQPVPTYIDDKELVLKNKMDVSENIMKEIKTIGDPTFLSYHLVKPFNNLQSDNFSMETAIKNTYADGPAVCQTVKILVLCSRGAFIIPFSIAGCVSDINFKANDNYFPGKSNDLSSFSADLSDWSPVRVEVKNRVLKVFLHGKLIREATYKEEAGEVVGLRFSFLGAGSVKEVRLRDGSGNLHYSNSFN